MAASKAQELRRLMKQQKNESRKIDHPFAKYNSIGQLTCQLCNHVLKSDLLWNTHLQSKRHRESVTFLKERKCTESMNKKRQLEENPKPDQPQIKKSKDNTTSTDSNATSRKRTIDAMSEDDLQKRAIAREIDRLQSSPIFQKSPSNYYRSNDELVANKQQQQNKNGGEARKITSSQSVDSNSKKPRKLQGCLTKERTEEEKKRKIDFGIVGNGNYNSEEEFVFNSGAFNSERTFNQPASESQQTNSTTITKRPSELSSSKSTAIAPIKRNRAPSLNTQITERMNTMTSALSNIQENISALTENVNQVVKNQAQLQTMMIQLETNQERIMGKMSFGNIPTVPSIKPPITSSHSIKSGVNMSNSSNIHSTPAICHGDSTNVSNESSEGVMETVSVDDAMNDTTDTSELVEKVADRLVDYLTRKNKMELFEPVLTLICEHKSRSNCMVALLYSLFTKEEMADTWYGNNNIRARKPLDPKRVSLVKDITLLRFPINENEGESRKKILLNLNSRISNKCRFVRNKMNVGKVVLKTEEM